jgi:hypothetical protein
MDSKEKGVYFAYKQVMGYMSLEDGAVIMTGTPAGVAVVNAGDQFTGKIFSKDGLFVAASWVVQ